MHDDRAIINDLCFYSQADMPSDKSLGETLIAKQMNE